ncbi:MAG: pyruvate kinase [Elusimicrobiota bacterium]
MQQRRAKIVCTLGPASADPKTIRALVDRGMDVVRLNFSHGTHAEHARSFRAVRGISRRIKRPLAIIADLQGPKIRTGALAGGKPVRLQDGGTFTLTTRRGAGDARRTGTDFRRLHQHVHRGSRILLDDGLLELRVLSVRGRDIRCRVVHGGELGEHKGINLPHSTLGIPLLDAKDRGDLAFALRHGADYIAVSFVRSAQDILAVRRLIRRGGGSAKIIAKLEKAEALAHLDEILKVSDAVMVARGDLGVEMPPEKVPPAQKRIIQRAREFCLPVITATQMLDSMTRNPRPTRAEASDVANAVFDGSDALMLSGETASGRYPLETVSMMDRIIREAEAVRRPHVPYLPALPDDDISESICRGVCEAARALPVRCIAVFTETGRSARVVAHYRPGCPIAAFSPDERTRRRLALLWGVRPHRIARVRDIDALARTAEKRLIEEGLARRGDLIGIIAGTPLSKAGTTNMMKLHIVGLP